MPNILKPFERLRRVFNDSEKKERLRRRFGLSGGHVDKWCRDPEGDNATGHPNPLDRVRDIIDEALILDRTGDSALLIASDSLEYFNSIFQSSLSAHPIVEANSLLSKTTDIVTQLNMQDLQRMSKPELQALIERATGAACAAERIRALATTVLQSGGAAEVSGKVTSIARP